MKQLRLYQGYTPQKAKAFYEGVLIDMKVYGQLFTGNEIKSFIENPFEVIKDKALIVIDHLGKNKPSSKIDWNALLNKLYSNWKDEYKCSVLIFTNDPISKTLIRDPKVEYKRI